MSQFAKYALGAAAALFLTAWQGVAVGTSVGAGTASIGVSYADLDLNRPTDVKILYRRINLAAEEVCGPRSTTGTNLPLPSWERCVAQAVDATVAKLDRPALSAYHREHSSDAARKS
jgi:UrcA family protein